MFNVDEAVRVSGVEGRAEEEIDLKPQEVPRGWKWISRDGSVTHSSLSKEWGIPHNHTLLTTMEGKQSFHTDAERKPWIVIDLKKEQPVIGLEILNRTDGHKGRTKNLYVRLSNDGRIWEQVFTSEETRLRWLIDLKQPKQARYVKVGLINPNPGYFHLKGVKVYAVEQTDSPSGEKR